MLREQVITPRNARSTQTRDAKKTQRPVGRARAGAPRPSISTARQLIGYLPLLAKLLLVACCVLFIVAAYRAAASAAFFEIRRIDTSGAEQTSARDVETVVRRVNGSAGAWNADLERISEELERLPWVRTALVTRVLPSGLRIRIAERTPRAVVRLSNRGNFAWVDADGYLLGGVSPTDQTPPFFVHGWDEARSDAARRENRERIERYTEMQREWEAAGIANRISEVSLEDLHDVRVALAGGDSNIEVRLGSGDFGNRLRHALDELDRQRQTPRGALISYLDATVDRRVIIGLVPGITVNVTNAPGNVQSEGTDTIGTSATSPANRTALRGRTLTSERAGRNERDAEPSNRAQRSPRRGEEANRRQGNAADRGRTNAATRTPAVNERPRRARL